MVVGKYEGVMERILRQAGIPLTPYKIETAREFSGILHGLFDREHIEFAISQAQEENFRRLRDDRIQVFLPCDTDSLTPQKFQANLVEPRKYPVRIGEEIDGMSVYGTGESAFNGRIIKGRVHPGFIVFDTATGLAVDMINREGQTIMDLRERTGYLSMLEEGFGYSVAWSQRPLLEEDKGLDFS